MFSTLKSCVPCVWSTVLRRLYCLSFLTSGARAWFHIRVLRWHRWSLIYRCWITRRDLRCGKSRCGRFWHNLRTLMRRWMVSEANDRSHGPLKRSRRIVRLCLWFNFIYIMIFCKKCCRRKLPQNFGSSWNRSACEDEVVHAQAARRWFGDEPLIDL